MFWKKKQVAAWAAPVEPNKAPPSPNAEHAVFSIGDSYIVRRVHTGEAIVLVGYTPRYSPTVRFVNDVKIAFSVSTIGFSHYGYSLSENPYWFDELPDAIEVAQKAEAKITRMEREINSAFAPEVRVWR